jgi:hypothetical protein
MMVNLVRERRRDMKYYMVRLKRGKKGGIREVGGFSHSEEYVRAG